MSREAQIWWGIVGGVIMVTSIFVSAPGPYLTNDATLIAGAILVAGACAGKVDP